MSIFDRNLLITTGISAVICGAVFYYLNMRIRELEMALAKQNQVLSSFIVNVQQEFRAGGGQAARNNYSNELASPEAMDAVANMFAGGGQKQNGATMDDKIVISDTECVSDDDSDSDDDSVSDNESVSDNDSVSDDDSVSDNERVRDEEGKADDSKKNPKKINLTNSFSANSSDNIKIIDISDIGITEVQGELLSDDEETDDEDSDSENEYEQVKIYADVAKDNINVFMGDIVYEVPTEAQVSEVDVSEVDVSEVDVIEVDVSEVDVSEVDVSEVKVSEVKMTPEVPVRLDDLRVDDLRKLSVEKGLVKKEEAKKLKKNELLALFKK